MTNDNIENRIRDLEREIASLPGGSIASKKINGKTYYYHRISINGKRKEIYIESGKVESLREQIERCRLYMKQLKELQAMLPSHSSTSPSAALSYDTGISDAAFRTYLRIGDDLGRFASPVKKLRQRDCFDRLNDYILNDSEKVMILYGLRRTGKTTLIRQVIAGMDAEALSHSAFMQVKAADTLADVYADLRLLEAGGFRNVFIDEVTLLRDFIGGAALFSDIFAASGMKLVLSGTDSLGFVFSEDEQLFDRCEMIHTTFIPYREFERVLRRKGIDEYIRYGGTMTPGGSSYNDPSIFVDPARTGEYVDSAIAKNIQHSLLCYQDGGHFMGLRELFEKNELTSAINRVVEDMNHRFTVEVLTRAFRSNDLALSILNRDEQSVSEQCRHLRDDGKCAAVTHDYGEIAGKYVIYCGPPKTENGVEYLNSLG